MTMTTTMTDSVMPYATTSGSGVWFFVIFFILFFWLICGRSDSNSANSEKLAAAEARANRAEIEKGQVINTAAVRYDIEAQNRKTEESVNANINAKYNADQQEKIFDLKIENTYLRGQIADDARFNATQKELYEIKCKMAKEPTLSALSVACPGSAVINPCNGSVLV